MEKLSNDTKIATIEYSDFGELLYSYSFNFRADTIFYKVGDKRKGLDYVVFFSVTFPKYEKFLQRLLPIAKEFKLSFEISRTADVVQQTNNGYYGACNIGKTATLFIPKEMHSTRLQSLLHQLGSEFSGPHVQGVPQIIGALYSLQYMADKAITPAYKDKIEVLHENGFINIQTLSENPKGDTLEGEITINGIRKACIIKEAAYNMLFDHLGRNMKDRLYCERDVTLALSGKINIPGYIMMLETDMYTFLVTEKINGKTLLQLTYDTDNNFDRWPNWSEKGKKEILHAFISFAHELKKMHDAEYVHLDVNPANCMISHDGQAVIIDVETAQRYTAENNFSQLDFGTVGFKSPNVQKNGKPEPEDDIYSLGPSLFMLMTAIHPTRVNFDFAVDLPDRIEALIDNRRLAELICRCIHPDKTKRPSIVEIIQTVSDYQREGINSTDSITGFSSVKHEPAPGKLIDTAKVFDTFPLEDIFYNASVQDVNLSRDNRDINLWHGLLNGNLGVVYTLLRAHQMRIKIPVNATTLERYLQQQIQWHSSQFNLCDKSLANGTFGLMLLVLEGVKSGLMVMTDATALFIKKCLTDHIEDESVEKAICQKLAGLIYYKELFEDLQLHAASGEMLGTCISLVKRKLVDMNDPAHEYFSQFTLYKAAFSIQEYLTDKASIKMVEKIRISLSKQMQGIEQEIQAFGLASSKETIYQNLVKICKIIVHSRMDQGDEYLTLQLRQLLRHIPEFIIHNNPNLDAGLAFFGETYLKLQRWYPDTDMNKRVHNIKAALHLLRIDRGDGKQLWISETPMANYSGLSGGNAGILNFLMDSDHDACFPMTLLL